MNGEGKTKKVKLVECPRDAMQGWHRFIPTEKKIEYLNALLQVGFDSLDFGSFVSPKAIPQMADTKQVISEINPDHSKTRLLAIVANTRGASDAASYSLIQDIGFPFSISETFQQRNTNASIEDSVKTVSAIQEICNKNNKRLVVYISMAFGNPYGDVWSEETALHWIRRLVDMRVEVISLADTVGLASAEQVYTLTKSLIREFPSIESGVHLHSRPENSIGKLEAAFSAGCRRFDGALNGIGGCPMAGDGLVGNIDTLIMIGYFQKKNILPVLNETALAKSRLLSGEIFLNH
ncbi:MAG TPA: hydroxymethylglutaryl-CoA lyase [Chitinophagaceae bacterium]|jgi:hydroxymethylglutaryl-CoA lyase|nr:hydroxymethylglutaryl-CoA lyase [Chitinophagaceae bacterium]